MYFTKEKNYVELSGIINSEPVYVQSVYGIYETTLKIPRLSDSFDLVPLSLKESAMSKNIKAGAKVSLTGEFRSYNKILLDRSRLILTVLVNEFFAFTENNCNNSVKLSGYLCKPPVYRKTPSGREICDFMLAVNRADNRSDYIPCIAWGNNAETVSSLKAGDFLSVNGRIQSRGYQKVLQDGNIENRTAYEASVSKIIFT